MNHPPRLAIIGRPNVGKSTLFNRLLGRRRALVHDEPGVTRDRLEEKATWWVRAKEYEFILVDTGGLGGDRFANEIAKQVDIALSQADVVIVLFDGQSGFTPQDQDVVKQLKQSGMDKQIPVLGVVNKVDDYMHETMITDFFASGLDPILTISAEHDRGTDDLKEEVIKVLGGPEALKSEANLEESFEEPQEESSDSDSDPDFNEHTPETNDETNDEELGEISEYSSSDDDTQFEENEAEEEVYVRKVPRIALVGRPNVGKSTMLNALLNEERMITSPVAGTTVDSIDTLCELDGKPYIFIDTAGIRRKSKTEQGIEVLSVVQTRKALERCDVAILLLDGESGTIDQDEKIGSLIEEAGCGVILAVNKWDTQRKNPAFKKEMAADAIRKEMGYLQYAPIIFTSAIRGQGLETLGELVDEIIQQRRVKIKTNEFTSWIRKESEIHNPHGAKFYLCHQSGKFPPTFVCHVNNPDKIDFSLKRHFINAMRKRWGFMGSPVRLLFIEGTHRKGPKVNAPKRHQKPHSPRKQNPGSGSVK